MYNLESYILEKYGKNIKIINYTDKNLTFDYNCNDQNINFTVELKTRNYRTDDGTKKWLLEYDVLIELVQTYPYFKTEIQQIDTYKLNTAIGWFYKCNANRLIFVRYLDDKIFDIIDLDFHNFRNWLLNNMAEMKIKYCSKTTGTVNAVVKLKEIPKGYLKYEKVN